MTDTEVLKTHEDVFYRAIKNRDFDTLAKVYSDDYMLVRSDGSVLRRGGPCSSDILTGGSRDFCGLARNRH